MNSNQYKFTSDTGLTVVVLRDEGAPYINGGIGGWTVVNRMRRTGLTQYTGPDPIRLVLPILFDGFQSSTPQEVSISTLERMARPAKPGDDPPGITVAGGIPRKDIPKWVIESIDYSNQQKVIWGTTPSGVTVRYRQDAVVNLLEQVNDDLVALSSGPDTGFGAGGASLANRRPTPAAPFYEWRIGDKLTTVSGEMYGSPRWARDILKANGLRDPNLIPDKTRLRMP